MGCLSTHIITRRIIMSLSKRCATYSRRSGALISSHSELVLIEATIFDLRFCETPVVMTKMGRGGDASENTLHSDRRWPRLDPRTTSFEILYSSYSRGSSPPSICLPSPLRDKGSKPQLQIVVVYFAPPVAFVLSRSTARCFQHRMIPKLPPVSFP
jgi:hypothetical protein